jgi:hypothetical protein
MSLLKGIISRDYSKRNFYNRSYYAENKISSFKV